MSKFSKIHSAPAAGTQSRTGSDSYNTPESVLRPAGSPKASNFLDLCKKSVVAALALGSATGALGVLSLRRPQAQPIFHPTRFGLGHRVQDLSLDTYFKTPGLAAATVGIYEPESNKKDIILVSSNFGYADFLINWICTSNPFNLKFAVLSQDQQLHTHLTAHTDVMSIDGASLFNSTAPEGFFVFGSPGFNFIAQTKILAVRSMLEMGYNVLFSDVDTVWLRNPLPHLRRDVDFEFQTDADHDELGLDDEPCTGFYYMKSNVRTISLLTRCIDRAEQSNYTVYQQKNLVTVLKDLRLNKQAVNVPHNARAPQNDDRLTLRQLPPLSFPSGRLFFQTEGLYEERRAAARVPTLVVHANALGTAVNKRQNLAKYGLWKVVSSNNSCEGEPSCYGKMNDTWQRCAYEGEKVELID